MNYDITAAALEKEISALRTELNKKETALLNLKKQSDI